MEVALTFGSLGDILQVCQIAIRLTQAIGVGCGTAGTSVAEFQALREELQGFTNILMQVIATCQHHEASPYLDGLDAASKDVVDQCSSLIQEALDRFRAKYQSSLQASGSGDKVKDVWKKLEWPIREKQRLETLRSRLRDATLRLTLLCGLATRKSALVNDATLSARLDHMQRLIHEIKDESEDLNELMRTQFQKTEEHGTKLERVSDRLTEQVGVSKEGLHVAKAALRGVTETQALLVQVSDTLIQARLSASTSVVARPLDPTKELPVIFRRLLGGKA